MITNQRQSVDAQLSTQAFLAAETGIQDAIKAIQSNPALTTKTDCAPIDASQSILKTDDSGPVVEYTCQLIRSDLDDATYSVTDSDTTQLNVNAAGEFNQVEISWHLNKAASDGGDGLNPQLRSDLTLPSAGGSWPAPAVMRAMIVPTPGPTSSRFAINNNTINAFGIPQASVTGLGTLGTNGPTIGTCNSNSATYVCTMTLNVAPTQRAVIRLRTLYRNAKASLVLRNNGVIVRSNLQVAIDVTARANDVYRRVEARVSGANANVSPEAFGIPDYAIETADDICKRLDVQNGNITDGSIASGCRSIP